MAQHLRFVLDGDDHLSPVLRHAGDSSAQLHRRLNDDMNNNSAAVRRFTTDANGRLRDLRGRFVSVADAQRMMAGGLPDLTRRLGDVSNAGGGAAASLGGGGAGGGGLGGAMMGVAAIAGLSLLPALGAVVPMAAGAGLALGTLKLGFSGVSEAMAVAGDKKEFGEALKKLPAPAREFTRELVSLKKEFSGVGKEIQKAMLPGFTRALKAAKPLISDVSAGMVAMGQVFGDTADSFGKLMKDSGFQDDFGNTLLMGTGFIRDITAALVPFTKSLFEFGAASGPTLKAFSDGISGLLSKGLPGFFKGLETGIPGAAKMLDGLFSAINDILPAIGRLSGELGRTFGPAFGAAFQLGGKYVSGAFDVIRGAVILLRPVLKDLTYGFKDILDFGRIVAPTFADVGSALMGAFTPVGQSVDQARGPLQRLNTAIRENKIGIMEFARVAGNGFITLTEITLQAVPVVVKGFRLMSTAALGLADVLINSFTSMFSWVPGIGDQIKETGKKFHDFKEGFLDGLSAAEKAAGDFAVSAKPKLEAGRLKLDINNWQSQIEEAKAKLKTVPPSKQSSLKATIADLQAKVAAARALLNGLNGKTATTRILTIRETRAVYSTSGRPTSGEGGVSKYAAGGTPKAGEMAMVGEQGPELVLFGEAARVVDAGRTKSLLSGPLSAGRAAAAGLAAGMGATNGVFTAARSMAAAVTAGVRAELEIASPSKKMKALMADVGKGMVIGLTNTRDKIKATAKDLANDIKSAFSGKKESSLLAMVDRQTKKLLAAAAKRDAIAAKIVEAKKFAADVTSSARDSAGLGNLGMSPEEVTAGGIKAGLAQKLVQIKTFTRYIQMLAKKGLNKSLLRQILNMGPDAGYAYASALVGADKSTFASINSLETQINKGSERLGTLGADAMYDSGKNASKGFLTGLQSQKKAIENLMVDIAKGMQKALRKALGIASPARKLIPDGINTARGVAVGVLAGLPHIDRAMDALSGRITGAATTPALGRAAVAGARQAPVQINVSITGAIDPVATARELERVLNKLKRGRGGAAYGF
ncbi:hypothetical protein [Streptomyces sp. NBC_00582]|uniref:hypothetical protein n=1 Tax=Streptomyces sp. NBC_00582 TaxID=2975783 RepID=UPI002E820FA1|nr:hypothetical protein [Streptomyces sp. NBC_00582]WUB61544.1 hypothetical protein OG852_14650 [Streptomyces sp. NBC_00582]